MSTETTCDCSNGLYELEERESGMCNDCQGKLTEQKALKISRMMWLWLAEHTDKSKRDWPDRKQYRVMRSDCACCDFAGGDCAVCPIAEWRYPLHTCGKEFKDWETADGHSAKIKAAVAIVCLCDKNLERIRKEQEEKSHA